jgi:hypothetical protein
MDNILANSPIRQLPIYRDGYAAGVDVGLVYALNLIVAEMARQESAAIVAGLTDPRQDAHTFEYAAGRLGAVARIVGAAFRQ